jgi:hypothetical protein
VISIKKKIWVMTFFTVLVSTCVYFFMGVASADEIVESNNAEIFKETVNGSVYIVATGPYMRGVYKYSADGKTKTVITNKDTFYCNVRCKNNIYYFIGYMNKVLYKLNIDDSTKTEIELPDMIDNPDMVVVNDKIYIRPNYILQLKDSNSKETKEDFIKIDSDTFGIEKQAADTFNNILNKRGYTSKRNYGNLGRNTFAVENTKNHKSFSLPFVSSSYIYISSDYIYYIQSNNINTTMLYRVNYDGTGKKLLCKIPFKTAEAVSIIDNSIYVMNTNGVMAKCSIDGTSVTALYSGDKKNFNAMPPTLLKIGSLNITSGGIFNGAKTIIDSVKISNIHKVGNYVYYLGQTGSYDSYLYRINTKTFKNERFMYVKKIGAIYIINKNKMLCSMDYDHKLEEIDISDIKNKPYFLNYKVYSGVFGTENIYTVDRNKFYFFDDISRKLMVRDMDSLKTTVIYKSMLKTSNLAIYDFIIKDGYLYFIETEYIEDTMAGRADGTEYGGYLKYLRINLKTMKVENLNKDNYIKIIRH